MMMNNFENRLSNNKNLVDKKLVNFFENRDILTDSMNYAIRKGKRLRPILFLETLRMLDFPIDEDAISFSLSIEFIHCYSLVHDDLPEMDNDDYRRGDLTVHKKFDQAIAVLCGDSLLNFSYENMFNLVKNKDVKWIEAARVISKYAGYCGMIEGQILDIKTEINELDDLIKIYEKKTANLFMAAVESAGVIAGLSKEKLNRLTDYALYMGICFQIYDDIKDHDENEDVNITNFKNKNQCFEIYNNFRTKALESIEIFDNNTFFIELLDYLCTRI